MAMTGKPQLKKDLSSIDDTVERIIYNYVYEIARDDTLADVNLEAGDALPEDASAEIIESAYMKPTEKGMGRLVRVKAIDFHVWA